MLRTLLALLPVAIRELAEKLPESLLTEMEELRIRQNRPLELNNGRQCFFIGQEGKPVDQVEAAYHPTQRDCATLLDLLTHHSVYSYEEELRQGYITIAGGHRVGLSGRVVLEQGSVKMIRDITGFNIRIARERIGCARQLLPAIWDRPWSTVHHTLFLSPPQCGKTTMIRDLARLLSDGEGLAAVGQQGLKVGIVDERSEIAASHKGVPRFQVGSRTDVLDGCPKAEGMMMMIRSLSPSVLIVDEIGRDRDVEAIQEALHAGIRVVATAHGRDVQDAARRPALRRLIEEGVFSRYVLLRRDEQGRCVSTVYRSTTDGRALQAAGGEPR